MSVITTHEIADAQKAWGEAILRISQTHAAGGDAKAAAAEFIDRLYAYQIAPVLFKPTKVAAWQFRGAREDALSYFVGGHIAEDHGFALTPLTKVRFENACLNTEGEPALAMGNYYFTRPDETELKVEYSFGYIRDEEGRLRIVLHHSSLPFGG